MIGVRVGGEDEFDDAFVTAIRQGAGALLVNPSIRFSFHRYRLVALAANHRLPAMYSARLFVTAGGLMSYGANVDEAYRWLGIYTGRVLKGEKPATVAASAYMPSLETAGRSLKVVPIIAPVHSDAEIETAIIALGREPGGGLVCLPGGGFTLTHRAPIISATARNNVPAVYYQSYYARDGGLLSYGPDSVETFGRAATYVDRILRGERPGDLPVQFPTKFEMVVNRKTAKALGLAIPLSIMLRADEVIE
jgi:ABC-type uncharacterized transport system substrate-binding protein